MSTVKLSRKEFYEKFHSDLSAYHTRLLCSGEDSGTLGVAGLELIRKYGGDPLIEELVSVTMMYALHDRKPRRTPKEKD